MVCDETIVETIYIYYVYVCSIKVEGYVTFLYEGSINSRYEFILCVGSGLCKPPCSNEETFKFFGIFKPMNVMT